MNTATILSDSGPAMVSRESVNHGRAASEQTAEGVEQRFADVLPRAEAALKSSSEKDAGEKARNGNQAVKEHADEAQSDGAARPASRAQATLLGNPQGLGWPLVDIAQPVVRRPAKGVAATSPQAKSVAGGRTGDFVAGQPTPELVAPALIAMKRTLRSPSSPEQTSNAGRQSVPAGMAMQPSANERRADVSVRAAVGANVRGQVVVPSATVEKKRQTAPTSASQETPAARTAQAVPTGGKGGQTGAGSERVDRPAASQVVNVPAKEGERNVPAALKPVSAGKPEGVVEKTKETHARPQPVNAQAAPESRTPSKVEKDPQVVSPRDGQQSVASKDSPAVSKERAKIEVVSSEGKDVSVAAPKESGNVAPNSSVLATGEPLISTQRPVTPMQVQSPAGGDAAAIRAPVQSIGEQILDSVQASATRGDRQVLVRLNPPELGSVLVRFQEQGELLTGTLEVSRRETLREIERALPQVVRSLQEAGVQVRRLDVAPSEQPDGDSGREHLPQDAWAHHQGSSQGREHSHASPQMRWSPGTESQTTTHPAPSGDEPRTSPAEGRIDLLL